MNANPNKHPDDSRLDRALEGWKVSHSLPAHFKASVWKRIDRRQGLRLSRVFTMIWINWCQSLAFSRRVQTGFLCAACLLGVGVGTFHAKRSSDQVLGSMENRYLSLVDPTYHSRP